MVDEGHQHLPRTVDLTRNIHQAREYIHRELSDVLLREGFGEERLAIFERRNFRTVYIGQHDGGGPRDVRDRRRIKPHAQVFQQG